MPVFCPLQLWLAPKSAFEDNQLSQIILYVCYSTFLNLSFDQETSCPIKIDKYKDNDNNNLQIFLTIYFESRNKVVKQIQLAKGNHEVFQIGIQLFIVDIKDMQYLVNLRHSLKELELRLLKTFNVILLEKQIKVFCIVSMLLNLSLAQLYLFISTLTATWYSDPFKRLIFFHNISQQRCLLIIDSLNKMDPPQVIQNIPNRKQQSSVMQLIQVPDFLRGKLRSPESRKLQIIPPQKIRGSYIPSSDSHVQPDYMWRFVRVSVIVSISPFLVGVAVFLSACSNWNSLVKYYHIRLGQIIGFSILHGMIPLGSMLGAMIFPYVMKYSNKRDAFLIFFIGCTISCGITCIPYYQALLIGRFILGIICGWQSPIAAILTNDLTPVKYRGFFGAIYFTARVIGLTLPFIIGIFFQFNLNNVALCVINLIPAYIALIQLFLFKLYIKGIPVELIAKNKIDDLKQYYQQFYVPEKIQIVVQNALRQYKTPTKIFSYAHQDKTQQQKQEANRLFAKKQNKALFLALHISILRQLCGVNYVTLYTTYVMQQLGFKFYLAAPIIINCIQISASLVGLYICHKFKRRPLLSVGIIGSFVSILMISIFDLQKNYVGVLIAQVFFMIFDGSIVEAVTWPYPLEVIPGVQVKYSNCISWFATLIVAIVPVRNQSYQFFFAVTAYMFISFFVTYYTAVESKAKILREVLTGFMLLSYQQIKELNIAKQQSETKLPQVNNQSTNREPLINQTKVEDKKEIIGTISEVQQDSGDEGDDNSDFSQLDDKNSDVSEQEESDFSNLDDSKQQWKRE